MLRRLLALVLTPLVLLPPGVCLCHAGTGEPDDVVVILAQAWQPDRAAQTPAAADPEDLLPYEDPGDHPPGCPERKLTDGQCKVDAFAWSADAPAAAPLPPAPAWIPPAPADTAHADTSAAARPPRLPLYVTLRAFRI